MPKGKNEMETGLIQRLIGIVCRGLNNQGNGVLMACVTYNVGYARVVK